MGTGGVKSYIHWSSVWSAADVGSMMLRMGADVLVREYKDGVLVREDAISVEQLNSIFRPAKSAYKKNRSIRKQKTKVHIALWPDWPARFGPVTSAGLRIGRSSKP